MPKKVFELDLFKGYEAENRIYDKRVHLGNGQYMIFTSKKELAKFSSDTRKYFWNILTEMNELYCNVFSMYRETWLISSLGRKYTHDGSIQEIVNYLAIACQWIEKLARRLRQTTEPSYICLNAVQGCSFLANALENIDKVFTRTQVYSRAKVAQAGLLRVANLRDKIDNYGKIEGSIRGL